MLLKKQKQDSGFVLLSPQAIKRNPNQPRRIFDRQCMENLKQSIKFNGIIQPIVVREYEKERYELIAGERRLTAAKELDMPLVPCVVQAADSRNSCFLAITENLQREDLSFFEQALALDKLISYYNYTQLEVAQRLGISQSTVANKLRLLRLSEHQRERIENMQLTERHARALLRLLGSEQRDAVLDEIITKGLNAEQTDRYVDNLLNPGHKRNEKLVVRDVRLFVNSINKAIEVMKYSGIKAKSEKSETDSYIKYVVTIPKPQSKKTLPRESPKQEKSSETVQLSLFGNIE